MIRRIAVALLLVLSLNLLVRRPLHVRRRLFKVHLLHLGTRTGYRRIRIRRAPAIGD